MQDITASFDLHSKQAIRRPSFAVSIDWDNNGTFTDESDNILTLEGERIINEPLQGIHQAQMDITLSNISKRYSPDNPLSPIASYIRINRKMLMQLGFNGENISFARGVSEVPEVDELKREVRIHFWDELENLHNFELSEGGELYLEIRTDLYLWEILDEVYADYFTDIVTFDSGETITGGAVETTNRRGGDQARKITATTGGVSSAYKNTTLDLTGYGDNDLVTMYVYIEDITKVEALTLRLHEVVDDTYGDVSLLDYDLVTGWNELQIPKSAIIGIDQVNPPSTWFTIGTSEIGGSDVIPSGIFDWASIVRVEVILNALPSQTVYAIVDEIRIVEANNYPARYFDIGLQNIPVAAFSGNTALFEIKSAAESEGGRFYADENGAFRYENRQHYNNTPSAKVSVGQLTFDRLTDYAHPKGAQGIINSVNVKINPRRIVATKEIWRLGETVQIDDGDTLTIWAEFTDPVPTTALGLITPVATTDYTANDAADGSGADRTADIDITITKFTNAAKLEIENTHSGPVYLTLMKLRGTPAEEQGEVSIKVRDEASIAQYGELKQDISTKYLATTEYAQQLGEQIIEWYKNPIDRLKVKHPALPQLQIGDMISVINGLTGAEQLMRFIGKSFSMKNSNLFEDTSHLRTVDPFELLTFFEIGTSEIGSTDVIAV